MALHWLIWLIVGGGIAFWSSKLGDKFALFFYLGLVFVLYGFVRMLISFMLRPEKEQAQPQRQPPAYPQGQGYPAQVQHPAVPPSLRQSVFYCPRCQAQLGPASRFCGMCGLRVR